MKYTLLAAVGMTLLLPVQALFAQAERSVAASRGQDLWGTWREGFQSFEKAEKAAAKKEYDNALEFYRTSLQAFRNVRKINADWNKGVISYRVDLCLRRIRATQEAKDAAEAQTPKTPSPKTALPAKRVQRPSVKQQTAEAPARQDFVLESIKARARLAEAEKEIVSLKRSIELNTKAAAQVQNLIREKNELIQKNAAINLLLENSKAQLARAGKNAEKDRRLVELRAQQTALNSQLRNMKVEMETLKLQKNEAQSKRNDAEVALRAGKEKITSLTAAVEAAKLVQKENKTLIEQLVRMKTDKKELENKLDKALRQVSDLSKQLTKIREGIDLPENIRKIQDNANVVLKDNEYLRTLNTKNMKELELLKKSNRASTKELKKTTELYLLATREYTKATKQAADAGVRLASAERETTQYKNALELMKKERDNLKTELTEFARKYETLLKTANRSDTLSAELLKRDAELKKLTEKAAALDLVSAKLRQEKDARVAELKKVREEAKADKAESDARYAELKKNTDRISAENLKLIAAGEALRGSLAKSEELNKVSQKLGEENGKLKKEISGLRKSIQELKLDDTPVKMRKENSVLKKQAEDLRLALDQAAKDTKAQTAKYRELKLCADDLRIQFEKVSAERKKLAEMNRGLSRNSTEAKTALNRYNEAVKNNNRLAEEYNKLKKEFDSFKEAVTKTNKASFSAQQLSVENEKLKKESAELRASLEKLKHAQESQKVDNTTKQQLQLQAQKHSQAEAKLAKIIKENENQLKLEAMKHSQAEQKLAKAIKENETQLKLNGELKKEIAELKKSALKQTSLPDKLDAALKENANLKAEIVLLKSSVARLMKLSENPQTSAKQIEQALTENNALKAEAAKLKNHISTLNADLRKNETLRKNNEEQFKKLLASSRNSEAFLKQRDATIRRLNEEIRILKTRTPATSSKEIAELSATVTELREGKVQFETALRNLTAVRTKLETENKRLNIELEKAQRETAAIRKTLIQPKPQGELERRNLELLESATKFEKLYTESNRERASTAARLKTLNAEMQKAKQELSSSNVTIERMRKELQQWTDDPTGMSDQTIRRKDLAIDDLVKESETLRKEVARLKTKLMISDDTVRRYREKTVSMEKRFQLVLASIKDYKNLNPENVLAVEQRRQQAELDAEARKLEKHKEIIERAEKLKARRKQQQTAEQAKAKEPVSAPAGESYDKKRFDEAMNLAEKAEKNKDSAGALMNYWRAADANPKSAEAYGRLSRIYLERGEAASAAKAYETSLQLGAKRDEAFENRLKEGK